MNPQNSSENTPPANPATTAHSTWLSPRRFQFWAIVAVVAYTLGGFFGAPLLVKKIAVDGVRDTMGRELVVGKVRINPYVLSAEMENVELRDSDGEPLFALDRLRANFQLSSLFRWAWTFREIRLDGPYVLYERFAPGDDRFTRLMADMERLDTDPAPADPEPGGLPRLLIHDLFIGDGTADVRDHVPGDPVAVRMGPATVDIRELNTLPDRTGQQTVELRFSDDAAIRWQGSLALEPLASDGQLTLQNLPLDQASHYLREVIALDSFAARLSLRTNYRLAQGADGAIALQLADLETDIEALSVTGFEPAERIMAIDAIRTRGGRFAYPEQRIDIGDIEVAGLVADLQLDADGAPRIRQLLPPASGPVEAAEAGAGETTGPWLITANEFRVDQARIALEDRRFAPPAALTIAGLDVMLSNIDSRDDTTMPLTVAARLEGEGTLGLEGDLTVLPAVSLVGRANAAGLPLALAQPYVAQFARVVIETGAAAAEFDLALTAEGEVAAEGNARIDGLQLSDTVENKPLLSWKRLEIDRFRADTAAARLDVSRIGLSEPFGRIQVRADRSTNLSELAAAEATTGTAEPAPAAETEPGPPADPWTVVIGLIDFNTGGMDFSDLSLPLPFAVRIAELNGAVNSIDGSSAEPAGIRLEGQVGDYGLARIEGSVRVFDPLASTDITMEFRNLLMSDLSPYSIEFAGRKIDEGKLNLDLEYLIENSRLAGQNDIVVSDLVLGAEVESPNAVSLPLDLAVALLKDSNGVIDIDLPVEGDVGDPEFRIGGVIWKAFTTLLTKIVTAPFALLGNLVGGDAEDFGQFEFLAGRADLTPPELEKIAKLTVALQQRPQIVLEIAGVYDTAVDTPMLQFFRLRDTVFERLGREMDGTSRDDRDDMLADEFGDVLEELHRERFPGTDLETIRAAHRSAPPNDPEAAPQLDGLAYAADLRDRLLESEAVGDEELTGLARARAAAIRDAFLATGALTEERIRVAEPAAVESDDAEWVVLELAVDVP